MPLGKHNELLEMNLTGSQSRKTVYEVRVYLYEPMWFKNNKTSLFLMHNPAVVMNVMRAYTHRLGLTLILTGMEIPETPQADAQKVPRALPAHKHTQIKAPTQTLPQHIRSLRTEASCRQLVCRDTEHARRLVDLHKHTLLSLPVLKIHVLYTPTFNNTHAKLLYDFKRLGA